MEMAWERLFSVRSLRSLLGTVSRILAHRNLRPVCLRLGGLYLAPLDTCSGTLNVVLAFENPLFGFVGYYD